MTSSVSLHNESLSCKIKPKEKKKEKKKSFVVFSVSKQQTTEYATSRIICFFRCVYGWRLLLK